MIDFKEAFKNKKDKEKHAKLEKGIEILDSVAKILYNNLNYPGLFDLSKKVQELKCDYSLQFYELDKIIEQRKIDVKK